MSYAPTFEPSSIPEVADHIADADEHAAHTTRSVAGREPPLGVFSYDAAPA